MKEIIGNLLKKENVRQNLSSLRQEIKDENALAEALKLLAGEDELLVSFMGADDAKTRKNAALLIGDLHMSQLSDEVFKAYEAEQMRFVKGSYLAALSQLDCKELLPQLMERAKELEHMTVTAENRKHIEEELNEINKILIKYNWIKQIPVKDTQLHPLGVLVKTDNIPLIMQVRTFRKMYFTIHAASLLPKDAQEAAGLLAESDMYDILRRMHREGGPFYYRIESTADAAYQSRLAKAIDMHFAGRMINSPNDYDVVIKLIPTKNDNFFVCMRLCSIQDNRFAYRKNVLPTSMHPSQAALIVSLAKPYLKETAQIMDPFCGVGTLLIERAHLVPAREIYATDTYGDAITMGRENAAFAKTRINFIHRDFFDFRHDYKFDELITDMPVRNRQTKAEMELFYERFFDKAAEHLVSGGIIVMYSNEIGFVKKQIRLRVEYRLLQETCILDKKDFYLFVIRYED